MLIKNLTITDLKQHIVLDNFSFTLGPHDKVGVIGEEGNGKSTLLKAIYDSRMIEDYTSISGTIDTQNQQIALLTQTLGESWNSVFIWEYLLKKELHDEIEDFNELAIFEKECMRYHIDPSLLQRNQVMGTLSGGEKVKLRLLKILHHACDVLLLDEPTNDLDIPTLEWLEKLIKEFTKPIMFISHDETLLQQCANVILHLEQRNKKTKCMHTVFRGSYDEYMKWRSHTISKDEQIAKKEKMEYVKKKQKLNDIQNAVHDALNDTVRAPSAAAKLAKKMKHIKAREERLENTGYAKVDTMEEAIDMAFSATNTPARKVILELEDAAVFAGEKMLLSHINMKIMGRDKVVITGANGSGKTLLMKQMYEILKNRRDIRLGYMPQNYQEAFKGYETPVAFLLDTGDIADITSARELLGRMKFTREEMQHRLEKISEGQKAKLYILKFMKQSCNVLLLDEPTRNLSPLTSPVIRHILKQYDGCIISISHDRQYIQEVCDQHYEVFRGSLIQR